jgi:hypothetical protein
VNGNRDRFQIPESYRLRELVLQAQPPEGASARQRQESLESLRRQAEKIRERLEQGESFERLARQ